MARTTDEIFDEIIATKEADSRLDGLTSTSTVSIWRLWAYITATVIQYLEQLFDLLKVDVASIIERNLPGTPRWYVERSLEFQYGYPLLIEEGRLVYSVIDEAAKIVKRAALTRVGNGQAILKVAKVVSGEIQPLSTPEMSAFNAYINKIMFAGSYIQTRSLPADLLKMQVTVFYDPLYTVATVQSNVEAAINGYINSVIFDGYYRNSKLVDAIQAAESVVDVVLVSFEGRPDSATTYTPIVLEYQSQSGYAKISPDFPLAATITYQPKII